MEEGDNSMYGEERFQGLAHEGRMDPEQER